MDTETDTDDSDKEAKQKEEKKEKVVWQWEVERGKWKDYYKKVSEEIEAAFQKKKDTDSPGKVHIDKERYVDLEKLRQCRVDNPDKWRSVRRTVEGQTSSPSSSTTCSSSSSTTTSSTTTSSSSPAASPSPQKPGLNRTYSQMTDAERRAMIEELQNQVKKVDDKIFMYKEKEYLAGTAVMKYELKPSKFSSDSMAETHFRKAESQFYRLMESTTASPYKVLQVDYIVNPKLTKAFENKAKELEEKRGEGYKPIMAFHGTAMKNIIPICKNNFVVPGSSGTSVTHATDTGWYGKGIYFSEYPSYSMGYIKDCTQILLCKVMCFRSHAFRDLAVLINSLMVVEDIDRETVRLSGSIDRQTSEQRTRQSHLTLW
eukprot:TRINITY_DN1113_c0_g1_i2.p1 TRINITY_DN1113_c0_g1~~TRINITY_DN1113_c0_g1_i2.p1  ORF type:complete len:419 (+),score=112.04 TRINITY_DN1113_c0_g1_i2:144-1259(+)